MVFSTFFDMHTNFIFFYYNYMLGSFNLMITVCLRVRYFKLIAMLFLLCGP